MKNLLMLIVFNALVITSNGQSLPQWSFAIGNDKSSVNIPSSIAADEDGNVYSAALFNDSLIMSNVKLPKGQYIMKWDNLNNLVWAKSLSQAYIKSVVYSPDGNLYLVGYFSDTLVIGGNRYNSQGQSPDLVVVKMNKAGSIQWVKTGGGNYSENNDFTGGAAAHPGGGVVVTGVSNSRSLTFGNTTITNEADVRNPMLPIGMFVVRYDSNGDVLWARSDGKASQIKAYGIDVDGAGRAYVTGFFADSAIINGTAYYGASDVGFLTRYSSNGQIDWVTHNAGTFNLFVAASTNGEVYTLTHNWVLRKYDSAGVVKWTHIFDFSNGGWFYASDLKADAAGNAYISSVHTGKLVSGSDTLLNLERSFASVFIAKFSPDGKIK